MLPSRRGSRAEGGLEGKQQAAGSEQRLARRGARITPSFVPGYKSTGGEDDIKGSIRRRRERCRRHQPRHGPAAASPPAIQTPPFAMTASVWMWRNTRLGSDATNGSQPSSLCGPDKGRTNLGTHRTITNSADKTKNFSRLLYSKSQKKKGKKALFACTQYAVNKWASVFRIERPNLLVDSWAVWTFANKSLSPITISVLRPYFTFRSSFPSVIFHFGPCLRKSLALAVSLPPPPSAAAGILAVAGGMATRRPENPPPPDPADRHPHIPPPPTRSAHQIPSFYGLTDRFWKWICVYLFDANPSGYWWLVAVTSTYHIIKLAVVKSWFGCNLPLSGI